MRGTFRTKNLLKILGLILTLTVSIVILQSCYPGEELTYSNTDIVATFYDKAASFSALKSYAMSDTVYTFDSDGQHLVPADDISAANKAAILSSVNTNLQSMGFADSSSNHSGADVFVAAIVTTSSWVSGGCYYGYWYYWYPYYGWCYPVYYTYNTGTILIVMVQKEANDTKGVWFAGINGLLADNNTNVTSRINQNIKQAFDQSPYLGEGK